MKELKLVGNSQVILRLCLLLYAILFEYNIHRDFVNRSSTEHVFTYSLYSERRRRQLLRSGRITQNINLGYACFQEKYCIVCIARAAVKESVCEDSHSEFAMVIYKTKMDIVHIQCIDGSIMAAGCLLNILLWCCA